MGTNCTILITYALVIFQLDTPDVTAFDRATASLVFESYNGGRDSKERMSQVRDKCREKESKLISTPRVCL